MKCRIEVNMDNAAFDYDMHDELSRALVDAVARARFLGKNWPTVEAKVYDINGNRVGTLTIGED